MDSLKSKSRFAGKSLQSFGRKIPGRDSLESSQVKAGSSGKVKEISPREPPPSYSNSEAYTEITSSSWASHVRQDGGNSSDVPGFLARTPDPKWIDIEMMGYWLQKCDDEHGGKCRKPFSLDTSNLGRPQWLVDVRRNCLTAGEPAYRYACLSYVVRMHVEPLFLVSDCLIRCEAWSSESFPGNRLEVSIFSK